MNKPQEALKMAIEWFEKQGYSEDRQDIIDYCKEALAELALEQMAENARELGLDYCKHGSDSACKECYMEKTK